MDHYQPMGDLTILLKPGEELMGNDEIHSVWSNLQKELYQIRGEVIAYGYDCESSVKDTIASFFTDPEETSPKLNNCDLSSIILKTLDFAKKIRVFEECADKVGVDTGELVKDLTFIRKRRNRFAHERIFAIPVNKGQDGFTPVFKSHNTETIINNQFIKEYIERCQKTVNKLAELRSK